MPFIFKRLVLILSITAAWAADKESAAFRPGPISSYTHKQTNAQVTIAVEPFNTAEKEKPAFGKLDLYSFGVLPVLVIVQNSSDKTIRLEHLKAEYVGPNGNHIDATAAKDVQYVNGPSQPSITPGPPGLPPIGRGKKNKLNAPEVEGRAFAAQMLPAGQTASGFLYFQTGLQRGATVVLDGLSEAVSGQQLFYFEIPLE